MDRITPAEIVEKLTERNLDWHLNHYEDPDSLMKNAPFYENTPFILVTAGVVERAAGGSRSFSSTICDRKFEVGRSKLGLLSQTRSRVQPPASRL